MHWQVRTPAPTVMASDDSSTDFLLDSALSEDQALALLKRSDLSPDVLEQLGKNSALMKSRKVKFLLVAHAKTPRHISLPLLRQLFTFDLMRVALTPVVPGDIKRAAEESLIKRLEAISVGEKLSLARRASGKVAGGLLCDPEPRVMRAALENPRLTEMPIVRTLMSEEASAAFVLAVCQHAKWSLRRDVRVALLRNEQTPLQHAREFVRGLSSRLVRETLQNSRLPANLKSQLLKELES